MKINPINNIKTTNRTFAKEAKPQTKKQDFLSGEFLDALLIGAALFCEPWRFSPTEDLPEPPKTPKKEPVNNGPNFTKIFFYSLLVVGSIKLIHDLTKRFSNDNKAQQLNVSA